MPLTFNLRHLEKRSLRLTGELPASDLDLLDIDEMIELSEPLEYDIVVERVGENVLLRGSLKCGLACQCVRCLTPFKQALEIDDWTCELPLSGEEKVAISNDFVDLTPFLREDILLAFPQHPLCKADCEGLLGASRHLREPAGRPEQASEVSQAWAELNKLKF
jgi:uncharacterized metal-binding protein YceD (DUF177 family)